VYYELLNPNGTVIADRYRQQLYKLKQALNQKRSPIASKQRKVILFHDPSALMLHHQ